MGTNLQGYHLLWPDLPIFSQLQFTALALLSSTERLESLPYERVALHRLHKRYTEHKENLDKEEYKQTQLNIGILKKKEKCQPCVYGGRGGQIVTKVKAGKPVGPRSIRSWRLAYNVKMNSVVPSCLCPTKYFSLQVFFVESSTWTTDLQPYQPIISLKTMVRRAASNRRPAEDRMKQFKPASDLNDRNP
ncbi:hypothetical protein M9H77_31097 [Catharanthus roseus]|uniref:Uncharacterized protein n=1 Tax=Catharanthus roseus TaxID=4058 RepID=A0ACC0A065_CATRO|nr:hypothetical protein M9H77_31097 [Catharanthus roseus]